MINPIQYHTLLVLHKARPKYTLYIFKKVSVLLLKCEWTYSTRVFSQEIFIGFNGIAQAYSEDVTE